MSNAPPLNDDERQRLKSQYAEIATLAGGLAHEIKNPLSTIGLNLELMAEELAPEESPRDHRMLRKVEIVRRECARLEQILDAFLQFARVGELQREPADLNAEVEEFIAFFQPKAAEHSIEISRHLGADLPRVELDRALIRQVLLNLALNALQAMPDGGTLELQTQLQRDVVQLKIIDSGCGMNDRARAKMFDPFFSTKSGGSGLGLPTVRKIVEAHDGAISCESEPGRGTRFTISLPTSSPPTSGSDS